MSLQSLLQQNKLIRLPPKTKSQLIKLPEINYILKESKISLFQEESDLYANKAQRLSQNLKE